MNLDSKKEIFLKSIEMTGTYFCFLKHVYCKSSLTSQGNESERVRGLVIHAKFDIINV